MAAEVASPSQQLVPADEQPGPLTHESDVKVLKWRSSRPGKIAWTQWHVDKVARDVLRTLPLEVLTVLGSPSWKGGPLVAVDEPGKPSASTLGKNFPWLLPFVKDSPSKVPSAYYICDVFLYLDALCHKRLFKPDPKQFETRSTLAAQEAVKVKKCLGTLRYLWRNASGGSHDENVQTMKSFLCPSPLQQLRQDAADEEEHSADGAAGDEEEEEHSADGAAGDEEEEEDAEENVQSEDDEGEAEAMDGVESEDMDGEADDGEENGEEWIDEKKVALVAAHPSEGCRVIQQAVRVEDGVVVGGSDGHDSDDSMVAPTLRMGESPDRDDISESDDDHESNGSNESDQNDNNEKGKGVSESEEESEEFQCSQVPGSGWMGKFYAKYGRFGKTKESRPFWPPSVEAGDVPAILDDIRDDFSKRAGDSSQHPLFEAYMDHCRNALVDHGRYVYATLTTQKHFNDWVHEEKAQDQRSGRKPSKRNHEQVAGPNTGFKTAMNLMNLDPSGAEDINQDEPMQTPACKKPRLAVDVARGLQITPPPVVGRQSAKAMSKIKKESKAGKPQKNHEGVPGDVDVNGRMKTFNQYDLSSLPHEALPLERAEYKGKHSYTVTIQTAAIEVLCKNGAYVIKRCVEGCDKPSSAQVTWSRYNGPAAAWAEAKQRAGLV